MSKLEYKIEDIAETENEYVTIPKAVLEMHKELNKLQYYTSSHTTTDLGEVYCEDCKHCIITEEEADPNDPLFPDVRTLGFEGCPISDWFERVWMVDDDFYKYGGYICDLKTLQPPPNCNCFEPKEGK